MLLPSLEVVIVHLKVALGIEFGTDLHLHLAEAIAHTTIVNICRGG